MGATETTATVALMETPKPLDEVVSDIFTAREAARLKVGRGTNNGYTG